MVDNRTLRGLRLGFTKVALVAVTVCACGGRTALSDSTSAAAGGAGGAPAGTGGAPSGTGGAPVGPVGPGGGGFGQGGGGGQGGEGGFDLPCALSPTTAAIGIEGGEGYHQRTPRLTFSSEDGMQATVVAGWQAIEAQLPVATELRHTSFRPWGRWPAANIAPSYLADYSGGLSFAAAQSVGDTFDLLFAIQPDPPETQGVEIGPGFVGNDGSVPPGVIVDSGASFARFLTRSGDKHLFGIERTSDVFVQTTFQLAAGMIAHDPDFQYLGFTHVGCALGEMRADAAPIPGGWILATSIGSPFLDQACLGGSGSVDFPNTVQVARMAEDGTLQAGDSWHEATAIAAVKVSSIQDGAVIAWTRTGWTSIGLARVDASGLVLPIPVVVAAEDQVAEPASLAATAFRDGVLLAWRNMSGEIGLELRDSAGALVTTGFVSPTASIQGPISLLASPGGDQVVVAWSESTDGGVDQGARVRLARIDCLR